MYFYYVDESGGCEIPASNPSATPLMTLLGVIIDSAELPGLTMDLVDIKRRYFRQKSTSAHLLDHILAEVKGAEVRASLRSPSRNTRRHATRFLSEVIQLLEHRGAQIVGRVWVKDIGKGLDPTSTYTYAVQDISRHFQAFLVSHQSEGLVVCDSRMQNQNVAVAHSIFTIKHSARGDALPNLTEVPLFGHSQNHAGLQVADLCASALVFPMAARVYCAHQWPGVHTHLLFDQVRRDFAARMKTLQFTYARNDRAAGGVVVSDALRKQPVPGSLRPLDDTAGRKFVDVEAVNDRSPFLRIRAEGHWTDHLLSLPAY